MSADRDLLFGIVALQMDFVSREQLVLALGSWVHDKTRPLASVLVASSALREEHRRLLEPLVEAHLARHNGDARQSLAALATSPTITAALARGADDDLRASLSQLGQAPAASADPFATAITPAGDPAVRFRMLRRHASGHMGDVYVAQDQELHREVALKEIKLHFSHDGDHRARFVREAEITGGLEHPGIVPVYGLGCHPDGRPYYAMRLIRGEPLTQAIARFHAAPAGPPERRNLELRKLLGRFVDVCNAVAYAHSRGVVHRDLKPDNIMLGQYGETLVVDWGLAKRMEPAGGESSATPPAEPPVDQLATQFGATIGTPLYMSPEQAAGRIDEVGPASDIYSLGATLYCLLAGREPFKDEASVAAVLARVQRGDLEPPDALCREAPAALAAICMRAMALDPARRHPTAAHLADDIERWLAEEKTALVEAAERARARADELAQLALETLRAVVFDTQRQLDGVPRAQAARRNLLATAIAGLNRVSHVLEGQADLARAERHELVAHLALGDLLLRVGDTDGSDATSTATKHFAQALAIARKRAASDSDSLAARRDLALAHNHLGDAHLQQGRVLAACDAFEQSLGIARELAAVDPASAQAQRDMCVALTKLGDARWRHGNASAAREAFEQALAISQQRLVDDPENTEAQRDLSVSFSRLGNVRLEQGDSDGARVAYEKSLALDRQLATDHPDDLEAQRDLAVSFEKLGNARIQQGDARGARHDFAQMLEIVQRLAAADPADGQAQRGLMIALSKMGDLLLRQRDLPVARQHYDRSLAIATRLAQSDPANVQAQTDLARSQTWRAMVDVEGGQLETARPRLDEARRLLAELETAGRLTAARDRRLLEFVESQLGPRSA